MPTLLSIAIDEYPETEQPLRGAVNDSRAWVDWFTQRGWKTETLRNAEASGARVYDAIERLMRQAVPGDRVAIHFSGHGSQLADESGDELDLYDECYCPCDVALNGPLRDDQLYGLFQLRAENVRLYLIADCCHSGSLHRGQETAIRYLPLKISSSQRTERRKVTAAARTAGLLLAACGEGEMAREITAAGKTHGVLTYAALQALKQLPAVATHRQWLEKIRNFTRQKGIAQTPQLIGNPRLFDEPIFGGLSTR